MTSHFQIAMFTAAAFLCVPAAAQEEAPAPFWVKQQAHTAEHTFMVQLIRYDDLYAPKAIKIIDRKSGAVVQEIADENAMEMNRPQVAERHDRYLSEWKNALQNEASAAPAGLLMDQIF